MRIVAVFPYVRRKRRASLPRQPAVLRLTGTGRYFISRYSYQGVTSGLALYMYLYREPQVGGSLMVMQNNQYIVGFPEWAWRMYKYDPNLSPLSSFTDYANNSSGKGWVIHDNIRYSDREYLLMAVITTNGIERRLYVKDTAMLAGDSYADLPTLSYSDIQVSGIDNLDDVIGALNHLIYSQSLYPSSSSNHYLLRMPALDVRAPEYSVHVDRELTALLEFMRTQSATTPFLYMVKDRYDPTPDRILLRYSPKKKIIINGTPIDVGNIELMNDILAATGWRIVHINEQAWLPANFDMTVQPHIEPHIIPYYKGSNWWEELWGVSGYADVLNANYSTYPIAAVIYDPKDFPYPIGLIRGDIRQEFPSMPHTSSQFPIPIIDMSRLMTGVLDAFLSGNLVLSRKILEHPETAPSTPYPPYTRSELYDRYKHFLAHFFVSSMVLETYETERGEARAEYEDNRILVRIPYYTGGEYELELVIEIVETGN
ncbi:MAG: hypothetical protein QW815_04020 [Nitrososphaerota archaeon]